VLPFRRTTLLGLAVLLATVAPLGCGAALPLTTPDKQAAGKGPAAAVSEADFAAAVLRLLGDSEASDKRSALLAGTIQRQLSHAAQQFERAQRDRGTAAVIGALYLLRIGEARPDMFGPDGDRALVGAIEKLSARGDAGRALALLSMRASLLPPTSAERARVEEHLVALRRWMIETRTGGDMEQLVDGMRAAVDRALVEPDERALREAVKAVDEWIARAVEYNDEFRRSGEPPPPEEAREALRALQTGGATMVALLLRHGQARRAIEQLDASAARKVVPPPLYRMVGAAASPGAAADWRALVQLLAEEPRAGDAELRLDPALRDAALWGAAIESYRRDRGNLGVAHVLGVLLVQLGMPEVAPLVLSEALGSEPSPAALSGALQALGEALQPELESGTPVTARRIFQSGQALLALGDRGPYRGKVSPSTAEIRHLMAGIEIRSGQVDAARPLLVATLRDEPSVWGYTMLGMLERQAGNSGAALEHARRALDLPAADVRVPGTAHQLDAVEAYLLTYQLERDGGATEKATAALTQAREIVTGSLATARLSPSARVRAERQLARVLDETGDRLGASRALAVAATEGALLGPTMLGVVSRALVARDVAQARTALQRGIDADLNEDDLVYGALWLMFLEQSLHEGSDGKVERVLGRAALGESWTATLARWARGRLDDESLRRAAKSYSQQVEARFYVAMRGWLAGNQPARAELERVAADPQLDLMEVALARDVLSPPGQPRAKPSAGGK
jgi:hypothetical protein